MSPLLSPLLAATENTDSVTGLDASSSLFLYGGFLLLVLGLLALDLGVFNRKTHVIPFKQAVLWTGFWVSLALTFTVAVYFMYQHHFMGLGTGETALQGHTAALEFLTAYLVEESLSLDNIFVIALIISYFRIPREFQHRVLYWGILGALVMRGAMIAGGAALIHRFEWMTYVFGVFLLATAVKLLLSKDEAEKDHQNQLPVRLVRKIMPVTDKIEGMHFFARQEGRLAATPLFLALVLIESADVVFAVDSIPAVFAVTRDPFLVFTSNIFAILGLRSLYFVLADIIDRFHYLRLSLVVLLLFIAVKMLIANLYHIPTFASLAVIACVLAAGVLASFVREKRVQA